jgi:hypothetical protein
MRWLGACLFLFQHVIRRARDLSRKKATASNLFVTNRRQIDAMKAQPRLLPINQTPARQAHML